VVTKNQFKEILNNSYTTTTISATVKTTEYG